MRDGKGVSRSKHDEGVRNGVKDPDKGHAAAGPRRNRSSSDSDDADVMRQLLSPESRQRVVAATRGRVARRRDVHSDGPASDTDDRASAMSEDEDPRHASRLLRRARNVGTESPATTPVGSPNQTPVPNSSSSGGRSREADKMDVDSVGNGRSSGDRRRREGDARTAEARSQETTLQDSVPPVAYVPCHTWPPCAVCARITKTSLKHIPSITGQFRKRIAETMPPATDIPPPITAPQHIPQLPIMLPPPSNAASPPVPPSASSPRPQFPPRASMDPMPSNASPPAIPRPPNAPSASPNAYAPKVDYPMEPLFISALNAHGVPRQQTFKILPPGADGRRTLENNMLNSMAGGNRPGGLYNRTGQRNAQASSSSTRVEDLDGATGEGAGETGAGTVGAGGAGTKRGRGKGRIPGRKQRAKRYNRKKHEEWPPEGWNPIWEEERPRNWGNYNIPDDVPSDRVYDHLKKIFDLKSAGFCHWQGCKPQNPENPDYKMLKRHVETVHLGLKLVCKLCGVRKRADNRRKATHKRGCPERENDPATATKTATNKGKATTGAGEAQPVEEDELMEDEGASGSGGFVSGEEGSVDEDEEIDQLEDDNSDEDQLEGDQGADHDQRMESEFESEDD
ncbi:hypothetical protein DICSQDRAFT_127968 [Dichomitus squalens LYAD-421 SS1]|uniref:Uncharacterized protein n=2 Tax=Dichomitus squalens TaxID=114155 RepID=A0A4Q9MPR2_9APHY|nr:uncharacterized protein DICSQDRAFT_127968 [Dichomitus squalens LYAD-421 SS1]EJF60060.1 hypothetical protein DICSQDRAFT_127968 [Dichomitus squalens LYAD-421 SS1]TBU29147.1 hypothetical protein BD311DRAFT_297986 [Dichomitus squalens]